MTKEEAIEQIKNIKIFAIGDGYTNEAMNALDMAIEALEQQQSEDAINRQAVLSYIYNDLGLGDEENGNDVERQMELERSYEYVKSLPPVIPKKKTGKWIRGGYDDMYYICSECNYKATEYWLKPFYKHCPNCGAKMENYRRRK